MVTGWLTIGKKKYYLSPKTKTLGQMVTGPLKIRKKTYKFNKSGVCLNP
jgi:glucan-binding YG repeat protein